MFKCPRISAHFSRGYTAAVGRFLTSRNNAVECFGELVEVSSDVLNKLRGIDDDDEDSTDDGN